MSKNHLSSKIKLRPPLLFSSIQLRRLKYALAVKVLNGRTDCTQIKQFRSSSNNLQGGSIFWRCISLFKWKLLSSTFLRYLFYAAQGGANFWSPWMKSCGVTIKMKASEQYFPVVLFIMLYKVVLTFESVDEILWCDHSNESYWAVLSCGTVYYAVQGGSNFWVCVWNPMVWPFKWKLLNSTFLWLHHTILFFLSNEICFFLLFFLQLIEIVSADVFWNPSKLEKYVVYYRIWDSSRY